MDCACDFAVIGGVVLDIQNNMDSKELTLACMKLADNRKGEKIVALDVAKITSVADYFVICSGSSEPHLRAILNEIRDNVFDKYHLHPNSMDGIAGGGWVVLDYYDVIVHVMRSDIRERYDLESFWGDARRLTLEDMVEPEKKKAVRKPVSKRAVTKKTVATSAKKKSSTKRTTTSKKVATKKVATKSTPEEKTETL